jgi:hypothetical protein
MPRYHFNLHLESTLLPDAEGQDLDDPDAAWEAARAAALDLMRTEFQRPIDWFSCRFEVQDEAGTIVLEFPFAEAIESNRPPN